MKTRIDDLRSGVRRAIHAARRAVDARAAMPMATAAGRGDARVRAMCPVDHWEFKPLYTEGACPLCGWAPPAFTYRPPLLHRLEWFWVGLASMALVSIVMLIVVLNAYTSGS